MTGLRRFIHRWLTLVHAMLRINNVTYKWNSWLADWWSTDVMSSKLLTVRTKHVCLYLFHLFYKSYIKSSQIMNKNDVKTKYKCKRWISFFWRSSKYERNWSSAKLMRCPYFARDPLHSYFDEHQKNESFLIIWLEFSTGYIGTLC